MRRIAVLLLTAFASGIAFAQSPAADWPIPPAVDTAVAAADYPRASGLLQAEIARCQIAGDGGACNLLWNALYWVARLLDDQELENVAVLNLGSSLLPEKTIESFETARHGRVYEAASREAELLERQGNYEAAQSARERQVAAAPVPSAKILALSLYIENLSRQGKLYAQRMPTESLIRLVEQTSAGASPHSIYLRSTLALMLASSGELKAARVSIRRATAEVDQVAATMSPERSAVERGKYRDTFLIAVRLNWMLSTAPSPQ